MNAEQVQVISCLPNQVCNPSLEGDINYFYYEGNAMPEMHEEIFLVELKPEEVKPEEVKPEAKKMCQHCGLQVINRPRDLCTPCFKNKGIRYLYPAKNICKDVGNLDEEYLERESEAFRKASRPCVHDRWDGECPICERAQRAELFKKLTSEEVEVASDKKCGLRLYRTSNFSDL